MLIMPLAIVTVAAKIGIMVLGIGLSILAGKLLAEKAKKSVLEDDKPTTLSQRGSYVPVVIGRRRVGAVFAWAGDRFTRDEVVSSSKGGKGSSITNFFDGPPTKQKIFFENGWHVLCVGPAFKLWKIWQHGELLFRTGTPQTALRQEPLTPATHPSGTTIDFGKEGQMTIFWGEKLQPINTDLGDPNRIGINSRWPFMCYVYWEAKRLGTTPIWPLMEYEIEVRPNNVNLSSSDSWITPERGTIWSDIIKDEIFKQRDFTSTLLASFLTVGGSIRGVSTMDDDDNVLAMDPGLDQVDKHVGFSSTVLGTVDVSSIDGSATGVTSGIPSDKAVTFPQPVNLYICGLSTDKLYELAGFSSTINNTVDVSGIGVNPGGLTRWNEFLTVGSEDVCFFSQTLTDAFRLSNFTTTVKTTVDHTGVLASDTGISNDGISNHILMVDILDDELVQFSGFTSTQNAIVDISATASSARGIAHERMSDRILDFVVFDPEQQGANAAHMIDQLLFEKYPRGIGLPTTDFDLPSLEVIGTTLDFDNEFQPSNLMLVEGEKFQAAMAAIMQDIGMFIAWDVTLGKYIFTLIREPTGLLPAVTLDLQTDALPERITIHDDLAADRIVFSFPDRSRNYRDTTLTLNDDGQAELVGVTKARNSRMTTITDFVTAQQVSERRAQEEMVAPTRFKIKTARAFRTLIPGESFTLDGLDPVLRLLGMGLDTESDQVVLDCIVDSYGLSKSTAVQNPGGGLPPVTSLEFFDLAFTFFEVNKYIADGAVSLIVPRIRANVDVSKTFIHISRNDVSYINVSENSRLQTGGLLRDAIAIDDPTIITTGPEFDILGPDIGIVQDLSGDDFSWKSGRQIAIINDELFFVQKIIILSATVARMDGLIRARLATTKAAHSISDNVFILAQADLEPFSDLLITPLVDIFLKSQPQEKDVAILDDITAVTKKIKGDALRGLPVENINSLIGDRTWVTGNDLDIDWSFRSTIDPRTGAGQQGAGEATTLGTIQGTFTVRIKDIADVLKRTIEGLTTNAFTYTNADMVSDFAGEPTSLKVEVVNVDNGLESDPRVVTMEKN